jgi:MFS family permease
MSANGGERSRRGWRSAVRGNVLMMGLVSLFTDFSSEMMNPLLPLFFAGLAPALGAAFWVGLSEGLAETTASLLKIFSGRISDRLHKRKALVVAGYGLSSLGRPAIALAGVAWHVVALKFVDRIGKGLRTSPRDALIGDSVDERHRGLAFSFHRVMDHTGAVLGPVTAILLLYAWLGYARWGGSGAEVSAEEMHAMRVLFAVALAPGVVAVALLVFGVREVVPAATDAEKSRDAPAWRELPRRFKIFVAIVSLFALGNSSDMFLLLYGHELFGWGLLPLILLWSALHISKIVFSIPGGVVSDRLGRRPVIVVGWIAYALIYLGLAFVATEGAFWALFVAYGFYHGMTEGAEKALVTDFVPSSQRGTAFGIYHGAIGLAALPASLLFGVFWETIGPRISFGIGAGLAGLAAVGLVTLISTGDGGQHLAVPGAQ